MRILLVLTILASSLLLGCGKKDAPAAGGAGGGAAAVDGPNPWKVQKEMCEGFLAHMEKVGAADKDAFVAAAQKFVDEKKEAHKANCVLIKEYRQDLKKSAMAEGFEMDFTASMERLNKAGGGDLKLFSKVGPVFQTIWGCEQPAQQ